jgi:phosphoglycolate phosphatase
MNLQSPKIMLFDWDNTLVDTWPVIHAALNITLRAMNKPEWSMETVRANVKQSMRDAFPVLFGDRYEDAAELYQSSYRSMHTQALQALPGARETLEHAKNQGIICGVVSNKRGPTLREEITHLGWDDYFFTAIGSGDAARDKPHGDPGFLALSRTAAVMPQQLWFIGDTEVDLHCAHAIGAAAILYGPHDVAGNVHDGAAFHAHVRDHAQFMALLAVTA